MLNQLQNEYDRYRRIKFNASCVCNTISSLRATMNKTSTTFEESVIIDGHAYDDGLLEEYSSKLSGVYDKFQSIINICNTKMNQLLTKINNEKRRLARLAEQKKSSTTSTSSSSRPNSSSRDSGLPSALRF